MPPTWRSVAVGLCSANLEVHRQTHIIQAPVGDLLSDSHGYSHGAVCEGPRRYHLIASQLGFLVAHAELTLDLCACKPESTHGFGFADQLNLEEHYDILDSQDLQDISRQLTATEQAQSLAGASVH